MKRFNVLSTFVPVTSCFVWDPLIPCPLQLIKNISVTVNKTFQLQLQLKL